MFIGTEIQLPGQHIYFDSLVIPFLLDINSKEGIQLINE
jgi:hypothetical protein